MVQNINFKAKNPELDRLHEAASKRLEELKISKETMTQLKKKMNPMKKRAKVDVTMENDDEQEAATTTSNALIAEEN